LKQTLPALSFNGVASSGACTPTISLPIGLVYDECVLVYSGVTLAQITNIKVKYNGHLLMDVSATDLDAMNQYDGRAAAAGYLSIPFTRYALKSQAEEEETAIVTGDLSKSNGKIISQLTIDLTISSGASGTVLSLMPYVNVLADSQKGNGTGFLKYMVNTVKSFSGAGTFDISDMVRGNPDSMMLNRVMFVFDHSVGNISNVDMKVNNVTVFSRSDTVNAHIQNDGVRVAAASNRNLYAVDTSENGYGAEVVNLTTVNDIRFSLTVTAAMSVTVYYEYIGVQL
jgi:Viral coat protein P2 N-terminal domain